MKLKIIFNLVLLSILLASCAQKLKRADQLFESKGTASGGIGRGTLNLDLPPLKENQVAIVGSVTNIYDFEIYENFAISTKSPEDSLAKKIAREITPSMKYSEIYRICLGQDGHSHIAERGDGVKLKTGCVLPDSTFIIY